MTAAPLVAGDAGKAKSVMKMKGDAVEPPPLPVALPLRAQLQGANGRRWEATYSGAGAVRSTDVQVEHKAD